MDFHPRTGHCGGLGTSILGPAGQAVGAKRAKAFSTRATGTEQAGLQRKAH